MVVVNRSDALRAVAQVAQCEIALVRRDPVAAALLAQAARAVAGLPCGDHLALAAEIARDHDPTATTPEARARHKALQAMVRHAAQATQDAALA